MKELVLRSATTADAPRLAEIYNHYILHSTATFETAPVTDAEMARRVADISGSYPYFVGLREDRIVGYCYAHPWNVRAACKGHSLETTVYVDHEAERHGVGTALMRHLIDHCRQAGCHALVANITDRNKPSMRMHEKLGFCLVGHYLEVAVKMGQVLGTMAYELLI